MKATQVLIINNEDSNIYPHLYHFSLFFEHLQIINTIWRKHSFSFVTETIIMMMIKPSHKLRLLGRIAKLSCRCRSTRTIFQPNHNIPKIVHFSIISEFLLWPETMRRKGSGSTSNKGVPEVYMFTLDHLTWVNIRLYMNTEIYSYIDSNLVVKNYIFAKVKEMLMKLFHIWLIIHIVWPCSIELSTGMKLFKKRSSRGKMLPPDVANNIENIIFIIKLTKNLDVILNTCSHCENFLLLSFKLRDFVITTVTPYETASRNGFQISLFSSH